MSEMIRQEAASFVGSLLTGAVLIWCYLILVGFRKLVRHGVLAVNIEDFLYWCVAALIIFVSAFRENSGEVRWYSVAAILIGAWAQWGVLFFLHGICIKLLKKFRNRGKMT